MKHGYSFSSLLWSIRGSVGSSQLQLDVENNDGSKFKAVQVSSKNERDLLFCFSDDFALASAHAKLKDKHAKHLEWGDFLISAHVDDDLVCFIKISTEDNKPLSLLASNPGQLSVAVTS